MITVDLDRESSIHLLRVFFNVPRVYALVRRIGLERFFKSQELQLSELTVTFSPSGVGYHIKIPRTVSVLENLKIRALLWDDPYRLLYAFKKWTLNPDEKYVDLCFDEKAGRKEENLDLLGMIHELESPEFVTTLLYLIRKERVEEADKMVNQLAEKLNPHLNKIRGPMWVCCIAFNGNELREKLEKICSDIAQNDSTFKYRFYPSFFPEFEWLVSLFTHDKDVGWKRLVWLKNKARYNGKLLLKDAETRMWCKQRMAT